VTYLARKKGSVAVETCPGELPPIGVSNSSFQEQALTRVFPHRDLSDIR